MPAVAGWWDRSVLHMTASGRESESCGTAVKGDLKDSEAARPLGQGSGQSGAPALPPVEHQVRQSAERPSDAPVPS